MENSKMPTPEEIKLMDEIFNSIPSGFKAIDFRLPDIINSLKEKGNKDESKIIESYKSALLYLESWGIIENLSFINDDGTAGYNLTNNGKNFFKDGGFKNYVKNTTVLLNNIEAILKEIKKGNQSATILSVIAIIIAAFAICVAIF